MRAAGHSNHGLIPHTAGRARSAELLEASQADYAAVLKKVDFKFEN